MNRYWMILAVLVVGTIYASTYFHFETLRLYFVPGTFSNKSSQRQISSFANCSTQKQDTVDLEAFCPNRTILRNLCQKGLEESDPPRCLMSINNSGRMANNLGEYAVLYALARWNGRPAFMLPEMAALLRKYFRVTMPALDDKTAACLRSRWTKVQLHDWMDDSYKPLPIPAQDPVMFTGYPASWTFFDHLRSEIKREFRLHQDIESRAQHKLRALLGDRQNATFVGVHVRRTDYVWQMNGAYGGVVADATYLERAMEHFRSRYSDAVFVYASDDMDWCRHHVNNSSGDVYFAGSGLTHDPIGDFALLSICNHSIITVGTYGIFSAYLAGGETVRMSNYFFPNSSFLDRHPYKAFYLPEWIAIDVNISKSH